MLGVEGTIDLSITQRVYVSFEEHVHKELSTVSGNLQFQQIAADPCGDFGGSNRGGEVGSGGDSGRDGEVSGGGIGGGAVGSSGDSDGCVEVNGGGGKVS